CPYGNYPFAYW
nr:immunoglobulin heavy chain junction region [Mus musculus]MBK4196443.1 immunoglobulin heavy chain junction region [Mus musculus]